MAVLISMAIGAVIAAALVALPVIGGLALAWYFYKAHRNSPAAVAHREVAVIRELHSSVGYLASRVEIPDWEDFASTVIATVNNDLEDNEVVPNFMLVPIFEGTKRVLEMSGLETLPVLDDRLLLNSVDARNKMREQLYNLQSIYQNGENSVDAVFWYLCNCVGNVCQRLPRVGGFGEEPKNYDLTVEILEVLTDLKGLAEVVSFLPFDKDEAPTLKTLQDQSLQRFAAISGKPIDDLLDNPQKIPHPQDAKGEPKEVFLRYLSNWPLLSMLRGRVAYRIPPEARFEHMHVLGGTGHGKTQLLQRFICEDLHHIYFAHRYRQAESDSPPALRSLVVIDGQGDLIEAVKSRAYCAPDDVLRDKVILIDPTDITHPLALNMFDVN